MPGPSKQRITRDTILEATDTHVYYRTQIGTTSAESFTSLNIGELRSVASFKYGAVCDWRKTTRVQLLESLRTGVPPTPEDKRDQGGEEHNRYRDDQGRDRNRLPGKCTDCGVWIYEGVGYLVGTPPHRKAVCATCHAGIQSQILETPKAEPAESKVGPLGDFMESEVRRIAAEVGADLESVREIARETVAAEVDRIRVSLPVREIKLPDQDTSKLPEVHHHLLPEVIQILALGEHVMLTGPAGSGKSTIAHQAADALGLSFHPMSTGPADMESKIKGFIDAHGQYHSTPPRRAFEHGGLLLVDEGDNGHPSCMTALNDVLANGVASFPDDVVTRGDGFVTCMTTNTFGTGADAKYVGRNTLDAAFLDRFSVKMVVDYDEKLESAVALSWASTPTVRNQIESWILKIRKWRAAADTAGLLRIFSPRATFAGAKLLAAGFAEDRVAELTALAGLDDASRRTIGAMS